MNILGAYLAKRKAPDERYITSLKTALERQFTPDNELVEFIRLVREMKQPIDIPDECRRVSIDVRDPTVRDETNRVVATITHNQPTWHVAAGNESDRAIRAATRLEYWTAATIWAAGKRNAGAHAFHTVSDATIGDGSGWSKFLFVADLWEERWRLGRAYRDALDGLDEDADDAADKRRKLAEEFDEESEMAKKRAGPPFVWRPVDVLSIFPVWDGHVLTEMLEVSERQTIRVLGEYGLNAIDLLPAQVTHAGPAISEEEALDRLGDTMTFIEHWDDTYRTYLITGSGTSTMGASAKIVEQKEHEYGRVPYFWAPGPMPNYWTGRKVGYSVGDSKSSLVNYMSWLLTMSTQDMVTQLSRPMFIERPESAEPLIGDNKEPVETKTTNWALGELREMGPGSRVTGAPLEPIAPALKDMVSLVEARIQQLNTPTVSGDIGGGLQGAGFAINQVLTEAKTRHDPYIKALEAMLEEITLFLWSLAAKKVQEGIWVSYDSKPTMGKPPLTQWVAIDEDDLKRVVGVRVQIDPELPSAQLVKSRWLTELEQARRINHDAAIEEEGRNPDEVRRGLIMDEMRDGPLYKAMSMQEVLYEIGEGDLLERLAKQAADTGTPLGMPSDMVEELIRQQQMVALYQQLQAGMAQPTVQPTTNGMAGPAQAGPMGEPMPQDQGNLSLSPQGTQVAPVGMPGATSGAPQQQQQNVVGRQAGMMDIGR